MISPYSTLHNLGGAEVAAKRLAAALMSDGGGQVKEVTLLAALPEGMLADALVSMLGDGTRVVNGGYSDGLRFISHRAPWTTRALGEWLAELNPDVVHFHHFLGVGSDLIPLVRRVLPLARLVYTAHEMLLLCANDGKMVRSSGVLCSAPSNVDCSACVHSAPVDLFLRDDFFSNLAANFDVVISPSEFLAERLRSWLRDQPVSVIPNCPPPVRSMPSRPIAEGDGRARVGFFGQIVRLKGLHVLLDAALSVKRTGRYPLELMIFGTRPDLLYWDEEIEPRLRELREGRVTASYQGEFRNEQVAEVMGLVDWVAVPSLWWENAPTVMFEAMSAGRPVLAGNIGGMGEALTVSGSGIAVSVGSVPHWAQVLSDIADPANVEEWEHLRSRAGVPLTQRDVVERHLTAYARGSQ